MVVVHVITGLGGGGAEGVLFRLATHEREHRHHVISLMDAGVYGPRLTAAGVGVHALDMPRGRVTSRGVRRLYGLLRAIRPDVVQTWMPHADLLGGIVARAAGVRAVVWGLRQSMLDPGRTRLRTRLIVRTCAPISRWVPHRIVCCSEASARAHVAAGYRASGMVTIRNGYSSDEFKPDCARRARVRAEWGADDGETVVGMVGRWDPMKDHDTLATALARVTAPGPWRVVLAGAGMIADNRALAGLLDRHGLRDRVRLAGVRDDVAALMNAIDVHVLSSASEGFPNVLCEAMACGTPCVTTDAGDAADIVGDTGWVVPPGNARALAAALDAAMAAWHDRPAWRERQAACRARVVDRFGLDRMVDAYRHVWAEAVRT